MATVRTETSHNPSGMASPYSCCVASAAALAAISAVVWTRPGACSPPASRAMTGGAGERTPNSP